jgi:putative heme-binding domain-containing protein
VRTSRPAWARAFLQAVSRGVIPPRSVPIEILSTLRASRHPELQAAAQSIWGPARQPSENVDARMKSLLEVLQTRAGNPAAGRVLFDQLCATCHTLFQHGASIGPDLTGIDRQDRAGLLRAILDPSEVVLPEYQGWEFELANNDADADSQIISGFIEKETDESVTVRNTAGSEWTISKANIRRRVPMTVSIMPEGLLDTLSHEQVADLFSFLQAEREVTASHGN